MLLFISINSFHFIRFVSIFCLLFAFKWNNKFDSKLIWRKNNIGDFFLYVILSSAAEMEFRSPRARQLWDKWRYVWMLTWERQRRLHDHLMHLHDLERVRQFSWDEWRKRVSATRI